MHARYHVVIALTVLIAGYGVAFACDARPRCSVTSINYVTTTYICDLCFGDRQVADCDSTGGDECGLPVCPSWSVQNPGLPCNTDADCGGSHCGSQQDGKIAYCYGSTADTINGTTGDDILCGGGGNDTIDGKGGHDQINGEGDADLIFGGNGNDTLNGGAAATEGADISGDDTIFGDADTDVILGNGGRDYLDGGGGNDTVATGSPSTLYGVIPFPPDDVVGTLLCGGSGADTLWGAGPSHQCMDGGTGTDTCNYEYIVQGGAPSDASDIGTARTTCETCNHFAPSLGGTVECNSTAPCGCD